MYYAIGEVAKMTDLNISTLRYYDKEGLFPAMERSSGGIRVFSDTEIAAIRVIECLKSTGMSIKEIKKFIGWCEKGDSTLKQRHDMYYKRLDIALAQLEEAKKSVDLIKFKCWYYDKALEKGTEQAVMNLTINEIPKDLRKAAKHLYENMK